MFRIRSLVVTFLLSAAVSVSQAAPKVDLVNGFESPDELKAWQISSAGTKLVDEGVTQGKKALELTFDPKGRWNGAGMHWSRPRRDWSAWDVLLIDLTNPNDRPIRAGITIGDEAWNAKPTYWNRHNRGVVLPPGKGQIVVPVRGLYRGEPGSRNNDIKTDIDPTRITRFTLGFGKRGEEGKVIIDNIRFTKSGRPESVWAFDFGAASQTVMPGWTPVSNRTRFGGDARFGWVGGPPTVSHARRHSAPCSPRTSSSAGDRRSASPPSPDATR